MLLMMTILVMIISAILLDGLDRSRFQSRIAQDSNRQLNQAREALLGFSAIHRKGRAVLPCPDMDFSGDGRADAPCPAKGDKVVGWLPWQDLGLSPQEMGRGGPFWYAVATGFLPVQNSKKSSVLALSFEGDAGLNQDLAALVFAPGEVSLAERKIILNTFSKSLLHRAQWLSVTRAELSVNSGDKK